MFPDNLAKIVRLSWEITVNHPFVDSNKRIGAALMLVLLKSNGISIDISSKDLSDVFYRISEGKLTSTDLYAWMKDHIVLSME